jgi:succinate dehydrogenase/fumarate reductase flavoprotein subunit
MRFLETDILVIGGDLAGLRAAIEAAKNGVRTVFIAKTTHTQAVRIL